MRLIEKEMLNAIDNGSNWRKDNTEVSYSTVTGGSDVYLHGHHIATVQRNGVVLVNVATLRRWPTVTTKSRLRALGVDVTTKNYTTYLNGVAL